VLPHASLSDAVTFANRITQEVVATAAFHPLYPTQVSLSTGIVTCEKGNENDGDYVFREAMCRLLEAKSLSKDRLVARALTAA
jgi:GGDEF domain-containing protein